MAKCEHKNDILLARINMGEKIVASVLKFCQENQINGAWITAIGTLSEAKLAFYNLEKKLFNGKSFKGQFEIVALSGNVGVLNDKHTVHLHIVISDKNMHSYGGHLEEATVAATCELKIEIFDQPIVRKFDPEIGLNLIQIT